jgi:hypothetical protein
MSTPFAQAADVEVLFRTLSATEIALADRLLRMASNMIRQKVPGIDARLAAFAAPNTGISQPLDPDIATDVTATVVARAMRNPAGVKTQAVGPASVAYDPLVSAGYLYLTPDELAMLRPLPRPSIGTVRTRQGLAHGLERRADPELRFGDFGAVDELEGMGVDMEGFGPSGFQDPAADQ